MSETYSTLTADDVLTQFNTVELTVFNAVKGNDTDMGETVARITADVRAAWSGAGRALPDSQDTIPDSLKPRAIAIALWEFLSGVPAPALKTDERKEAWKEAREYLNTLAKRQLPGTGGAQIVVAPTRKFTRDKLNGLI